MSGAPSPDWWKFLADLWCRSWAFWTKDPESVRNFFVIVGGFIGLVLLWWRTWNVHRQTATAERRHQAQVEADRERRITDNFTRAVELLGSDELETRLGGIYALERIARESRQDHWPIMEALTAYVRERAPWPPKGTTDEGERNVVRAFKLAVSPPPLATDIQAILTVIGRRSREHENESQRLDLSNTDLRRGELGRHYLERIIFWGAHLEQATLIRAHLEGSILCYAHLEKANLYGAHLEGARFNEAHLDGTVLVDTDLTQEQFDSAITDKDTQVPPHIQPDKAAGEMPEARHEVTGVPNDDRAPPRGATPPPTAADEDFR